MEGISPLKPLKTTCSEYPRLTMSQYLRLPVEVVGLSESRLPHLGRLGCHKRGATGTESGAGAKWMAGRWSTGSWVNLPGERLANGL